ncbi:MAG: amidohydrolase/deacetylase family metallohydrolase [Deltaproteobacteria bacterium]|nr:amidohydrolase/deacetylase family metallohydrolase [Deltaproteobacteria bacterium]
MKELTRRNFIYGMAASAVMVGFPNLGQAFSNDDKFDLVIRGGEVLDPSQNLRARRDVGIRNAVVAALEPEIPASMGKQVIDAGGRLVLPGLIDYHAHVCPELSAIGIPADELVPYSGATTYVDTGDTGGNNFSAFKHYIIPKCRSRIYAYVHISCIGLAGFPVTECLNINYVNVDLAAKTLAENPDVLLGVKVRMEKSIVGENGLEPLKRAIKAAELSGVKGARVMCHIGLGPGEMSDLLELLRPGDVLTHCFTGNGTGIMKDGKVLPAARAAKERGVIFDVAHGAGSFDFAIAEPAMAQGILPDTLSSDVHVYSANSPGRVQLPWVMSKFLHMGLSLEQVVAMTTQIPAKLIGKVDKLGTLQVGAPGDVSILELVEEDVKFMDAGGGGKKLNTRQGKRYLKPFKTVRAGRAFGQPYPAPFVF